MISFILSPIGRWVVGGGAVLILLAVLYNLATQRAFNNGYSEGSYKVLNAMEEKMKTALESQREAIEAEKVKVAKDRVQAKADKDEALRLRSSIRRDVRNEVNKIRTDSGVEVDAIVSIPPSELNAYIRSQLAEQRELDIRFRGTATDPYVAFSFESSTAGVTTRSDAGIDITP